MKKLALITSLAFIVSTVILAQSRGTPHQIQVKVDANGYLLTSAAAMQTLPITTTRFDNARLATDANGYLMTVLAGGITGSCGSDTEVCFNNMGVIDGDSDFTWTDHVIVNGGISNTDTFTFSAGNEFGIRSGQNITPVASPPHYKNIVSSFNITQAVDQANDFTYMGIYSYSSLNGAEDAHALYGSPTDVENYNTGSVLSLYAIPGQVFNYDTGSITSAAGLYGLVDNEGGGTISLAWGSYANITNNDGTITNAAGYWADFPILGGAGTTDNYYAFYSESVIDGATNPYFLWYAGGGGDCNAGGVWRVNQFGILAYYNPCFATYTPGATNFERIIARWGDSGVFGSDNVAYIGVETGGTGTYKPLATLNVPAVRANRTTNQSVNDSTVTYIALNATDSYDYNSMHDTSTNNTRITFNTKGVYNIIGEVGYDGNTTGIRYCFMDINGTSTRISTVKFATGGDAGQIQIQCGASYEFNAGDYVELGAFQNSGGALNVVGAWFAATRVAGVQ